MKFYYKDMLVRTSKNHQYTHALIDTEKKAVIGCRTSYDACLALLGSETHRHLEQIENAERKIDAIENGRPTYIYKDGRKSYRIEVTDCGAKKMDAYEWLDLAKKSLANINMNWRIVELEAR